MTVVVILFLVVLWAVVLGPSLYRRWAEGRSGDSIGDFRSHLGVLRRTSPSDSVVPSHVLSTNYTPAFAPLPPPLGSGSLPASPRLTRGELSVMTDRPVAGFASETRSSARRLARKRRRDTLAVLLITTFSTLALGAVPVLRPMWFIAGISGAALVAYVALIVRMERNTAERRFKVAPIHSAPGFPSGQVVFDGEREDGEDDWFSVPGESVVVIGAASSA